MGIGGNAVKNALEPIDEHLAEADREARAGDSVGALAAYRTAQRQFYLAAPTNRLLLSFW